MLKGVSRKNQMVCPSRTGVFLRVCQSRLQNRFSRSVGFGNWVISQTGRGTGELFGISCRKFLIELRSSGGFIQEEDLGIQNSVCVLKPCINEFGIIDNYSSQFHLKLRGRRTHTRGRQWGTSLPNLCVSYSFLISLYVFNSFVISVGVLWLYIS